MKQMKPQFRPLACTSACEWLGAQGMDGKPEYHQEGFLGNHF